MVMRVEPDAVEEVYDLETDPAEADRGGAGLAAGTRKRLLLAARDHMEKETSAYDDKMRLRARLRDLRSDRLG
jgi:hypothetical protein